MAGNCPKCGRTVNNAVLETIPISAGFGRKNWPGVTLSCPSCNTVLGAAFDPTELKEEIIQEIKAALGKSF
jgi:hypothetical protein